MKRRLEQIEESVERYLRQLDSSDRQVPSLARTTKTVHFADRRAIALAEAGNRLVIRDQAAGQPHDLHVATTLALKPG